MDNLIIDPKAYIPAGCLQISACETNFSSEILNHEELQTWKPIPSNADEALEPIVETSLKILYRMKNHPMVPSLLKLIEAQWIRLELFISSLDHLCIIRVFLLPDDVYSHLKNSLSTDLFLRRKNVMAALDYSKHTWASALGSDASDDSAAFKSGTATTENASLLQLFNQIPSPDPSLNAVLNDYARASMFNIMDGSLPGLQSELYGYQKRSAAQMLQKEVQIETHVDPRLQKVQDQNGASYYWDPVGNTLLSTPRYYDGVSGGILAEEMGSGKTLICLALILATKDLPAAIPEIYGVAEPPKRPRLASLAEMSAACATRYGMPWRPYFEEVRSGAGYDYSHCIKALESCPGYYFVPPPQPRSLRRVRRANEIPPTKLFLSLATLIIVPNNLLVQWKQEIEKHTTGLRVLYLTGRDPIPPVESILKANIIIFSVSRFCKTAKEETGPLNQTPLQKIHFKRCIVDEGHVLGNSRIGRPQTTFGLLLSRLHISHRWIVTGTPSQGLYGTNINTEEQGIKDMREDKEDKETQDAVSIVARMERQDIERIGALVSRFLGARPWSNKHDEQGDTLADWNAYMLLPRHTPKASGRWETLEATLNSMIIRHRLLDVSDKLPSVVKKDIILDGCYQDYLSLNVFSMMIIFNSVQSQRTDQDYFFHSKQRRSLLEIVRNLKQSTFFGGSFFTQHETATAIETAEEFLRKGDEIISNNDELLLKAAIDIGRVIVNNKLRRWTNQYHDIPLAIQNFPPNLGQAWSLDSNAKNELTTSSSLLLALQKCVHTASKSPETLNSLLNGGLVQVGKDEQETLFALQEAERNGVGKQRNSTQLAGNITIGTEIPHKMKAPSKGVSTKDEKSVIAADFGRLSSAQMTATASAKLSYLVSGILKHQAEEKIIVFYENENIAWYLSNFLQSVGFSFIEPLLERHGTDIGDRSTSSISSMQSLLKRRASHNM